MAIIDHTYFRGQITIGQKSQAYVIEDLNNKIKNYENDLLVQLFGLKLTTDIFAEVANPVPDPLLTKIIDGDVYDNGNQKWMGLRNSEKRSIIANFVYFNYSRDIFNLNVGSGSVFPKNENSETVYSDYKQAAVWNEMIDWICELRNFMRFHQSDYPDYKFSGYGEPCRRYICSCRYDCKTYPFIKINQLNL